MNSDEIRQRVEAIQRRLKGESQSEISRALGKSRRWVKTWVERYNPDDPLGSLADRSSAPHRPHHKWSEEVREMVRQSRQLRQMGSQAGYEYALMGAQAIHYELVELGVKPVPPVRTIHAWLKADGLVTEPAPAKPATSSKPYPAPEADKVNAVHQLDMKGPLYLTGSAHKYYLIALRDVSSKAVAVSAVANKQSQTFLVSAWQRLGLPRILQLDNGLEFRGSNRYPRSFNVVVRLCLDVGVEPLYIPPSEPWRNGVIESFNGQAARLLLNRDHFATLAELQAGAARLETAINTAHRLPALDGQTPAEYRAQHSLSILPLDYKLQLDPLPLDQGFISLIRLVRHSGRITLHAQDKLDIDPDLAWQYVLARINLTDKLIEVSHQGKPLKSFDF